MGSKAALGTPALSKRKRESGVNDTGPPKKWQRDEEAKMIVLHSISSLPSPQNPVIKPVYPIDPIIEKQIYVLVKSRNLPSNGPTKTRIIRGIGRHSAISALMTCRAFYAEGMRVLYANTFAFLDWVEDIQVFLDEIGPVVRRSMKRIERTGSLDDQFFWRPSIRVDLSDVSLQTVVIHLRLDLARRYHHMRRRTPSEAPTLPAGYPVGIQLCFIKALYDGSFKQLQMHIHCRDSEKINQEYLLAQGLFWYSENLETKENRTAMAHEKQTGDNMPRFERVAYLLAKK